MQYAAMVGIVRSSGLAVGGLSYLFPGRADGVTGAPVKFRVQEIVSFELNAIPRNVDQRAILYDPINQNFGAWDYIIHDPGNGMVASHTLFPSHTQTLLASSRSACNSLRSMRNQRVTANLR
jgi:hypothetical protein